MNATINPEMEMLVGIIENPVNMGDVSNYVEIDTLEDCVSIKPSLINVTLNKLNQKGLVNINHDLVRITSKGLGAVNQVAV